MGLLPNHWSLTHPPAHPPTCSGAAQAGAIAYLLFLASGYVDAFLDKQTLPEQYTARNVAVLVQTVCRGLVYLATFIFGANSLGLTGACGVVVLAWAECGRGRSCGAGRAELWLCCVQHE